MSGQYDFREGMLLEKVVYKDDSIDIKSRILYVCCIILTWCWGCAWFALFFWAYIFHEEIAFWVFIAVWLIHFIIVVIFAAHTLISARNHKREKKERKEKEEQLQKEIEENKRKRARQLKNKQPEGEISYNSGIEAIDHNDNEINTGNNKQNNHDLIEKHFYSENQNLMGPTPG